MDEQGNLPEGKPSKDNHGREYAVAAVSIAGEYLAVRYGIRWLAWLAALFLWLSLIGYTRRYFASKPYLKSGLRGLLALSMAAATYALTYQKAVETSTVAAQQQQSPIQQKSEGANSPNTAVIGNRNVVNIGDPSVSARLDEITRLLKSQGERVSPDKLLRKYPLGYVIFDVDYASSVFPYKTQYLLDRWDIDWSKTKLTEVNEKSVALTLPRIRHKGGAITIDGFTVTGPKKIGLFVNILRDPYVVAKAEILAIRQNGIVFIIGFDHAPKD